MASVSQSEEVLTENITSLTQTTTTKPTWNITGHGNIHAVVFNCNSGPTVCVTCYPLICTLTHIALHAYHFLLMYVLCIILIYPLPHTHLI